MSGTAGGALDWAGLMRAGLRGLGLTPEAFWRLTPAELAMMLGEAAGTPSLVGLRRRWTTMVRMTVAAGGTMQQPTP